MRAPSSALAHAAALGAAAALGLVCAGDLHAAPAAVEGSTAPSPGRALFERHCTACHGAGFDKPGTVALAVRDGERQPPLLEQRTNLSPEVIRYFVRHGVSVMAPFRKTEISDRELDQLIEYLVQK